MTEHPILFNGKMVRAILAGQKTQTRWVVKPQPGDTIRNVIVGEHWAWQLAGFDGQVHGTLRCPCGAPGDLLWVQETWGWFPRTLYTKDAEETGVYVKNVAYRAGLDPAYKQGVAFRETVTAPGAWECYPPNGGWHPSIHMPRWASRITLRVTGVRVERVQEISKMDILAEGYPGLLIAGDTADPWFRHVWNHLHAKRGYGWDANPWVFVIEFERMDDVHG